MMNPTRYLFRYPSRTWPCFARLSLDGIPLTMPDGQSQLNNIDPGTVGNIEALRGPDSARKMPRTFVKQQGASKKVRQQNDE